jgi:hypothetical protein
MRNPYAIARDNGLSVFRADAVTNWVIALDAGTFGVIEITEVGRTWNPDDLLIGKKRDHEDGGGRQSGTCDKMHEVFL